MLKGSASRPSRLGNIVPEIPCEFQGVFQVSCRSSPSSRDMALFADRGDILMTASELQKNKQQDDDMSGDPSANKVSPVLSDKFMLRLPNGLREQLKLLSEQNKRSMNAEILQVLEKHIRQNLPQKEQTLSEEEMAQSRMTARQLSEKLESLPPGKKEALLELLG